MTEAHVSDDLWFASLPDEVRERIVRVYGGTPDSVREELDDAVRRAEWAEQWEGPDCDGTCEEAEELRKKLAKLEAKS